MTVDEEAFLHHHSEMVSRPKACKPFIRLVAIVLFTHIRGGCFPLRGCFKGRDHISPSPLVFLPCPLSSCLLHLRNSATLGPSTLAYTTSNQRHVLCCQTLFIFTLLNLGSTRTTAQPTRYSNPAPADVRDQEEPLVVPRPHRCLPPRNLLAPRAWAPGQELGARRPAPEAVAPGRLHHDLCGVRIPHDVPQVLLLLGRGLQLPRVVRLRPGRDHRGRRGPAGNLPIEEQHFLFFNRTL